MQMTHYIGNVVVAAINKRDAISLLLATIDKVVFASCLRGILANSTCVVAGTHKVFVNLCCSQSFPAHRNASKR